MKTCTKCKKPHTEKTKLCEPCKVWCRNYQRQKACKERCKTRYESRKNAGLCPYCKKGMDNDQYQSCLRCLKRISRGRRALRNEVKQAYGGKCSCCGEADFRFLTVDHINNDGAEHRRQISGSRIYNYLKKNNFPGGFQILCWNCNSGRAINGGTCPHREADPEMLLAAAGVI